MSDEVFFKEKFRYLHGSTAIMNALEAHSDGKHAGEDLDVLKGMEAMVEDYFATEGREGGPSFRVHNTLVKKGETLFKSSTWVPGAKSWVVEWRPVGPAERSWAGRHRSWQAMRNVNAALGAAIPAPPPESE